MLAVISAFTLVPGPSAGPSISLGAAITWKSLDCPTSASDSCSHSNPNAHADQVVALFFQYEPSEADTRTGTVRCAPF